MSAVVAVPQDWPSIMHPHCGEFCCTTQLQLTHEAQKDIFKNVKLYHLSSGYPLDINQNYDF